MGVEMDVLRELLSTLAETLPMTALLNKFSSKKLIDDREKAEIEAKTTDERKATYFLENMIKCLKLDDTEIFYSFLEVLETSDNKLAKIAGKKIRTELDKAKSSTQGSAGTQGLAGANQSCNASNGGATSLPRANQSCNGSDGGATSLPPQFDKSVSDRALNRIKDVICTNWRDLGSEMGFKDRELDVIAKDYQNEMEKAGALLRKWRQSKAPLNYHDIGNAIISRGLKSLLHEVAEVLDAV